MGATGMLGHILVKKLDKYENIDLFATARSPKKLHQIFKPDFLDRVFVNIDADNFESIAHTVEEIQPDVIINCIGIIKQLPLAHDSIASISINALFPHKLAAICQSIGARFIHISTDCVFKGDKGTYTEDTPVDATDLYGRTKFLGEVSASNCITLRTSLIGHELNTKYALIDWFLSQEEKVRGFTNAIYTGFPTVEMARIIADYVIPNPDLSGLYNVSSDLISKNDLLCLVAKQYNKKIEIEPYDDFFCDRSLDSTRFRTETGYSPPSWEELVKSMHEDFIRDIRNYNS